jgi:hypothetical protein
MNSEAANVYSEYHSKILFDVQLCFSLRWLSSATDKSRMSQLCPQRNIFFKDRICVTLSIFPKDSLFTRCCTNFELLFLKYNNCSLNFLRLCWIGLHIFYKIQASLTETYHLRHIYLYCAWIVLYSEVKFKEVACFIHFCLIFSVLIFLI